ncbi:MAG: high-potential iron-sulfur protein [Chromatiales bacterium]
MKDQSIDKGRRALLKGVAAVPVLAIAGYQIPVRAEMLSPDDPTAQALGYVEASATEGQLCSNCALYSGAADAAAGACTIFPGKEVAAAGWCRSWNPKA